ncbi:hypothetical protein C0584_02030 [Candidatus Parcubacteria bacterium]|nr:MAG: hypothetical protein C0584_02030 [Candidatus Parcubacteria bacterium]
MADKKVIAGTDIRAQQMKEFWRQICNGEINARNLALFLERFGVQPDNQILRMHLDIKKSMIDEFWALVESEHIGRKELQQFLEERKVSYVLPNWKTILVGRGFEGKHDCLNAVLGQGVSVCRITKLLIDKIDVPLFVKTHYSFLTKVSLTDLGLDDNASYEEICSQGLKLGLGLLTVEEALELQLQYKMEDEGVLIPAISPLVLNKVNVVLSLNYCFAQHSILTIFASDLKPNQKEFVFKLIGCKPFFNF